MKPTALVLVVLAAAALIAGLATVSGTVQIGPWLGHGPYEAKAQDIISACAVAAAGIAGGLAWSFHSVTAAESRKVLHSVALATIAIAVILLPALAPRPIQDPLAVAIAAGLLILASVAALRCFDTLAQGHGLGFESHWGGLGSGAGGWRLSSAAALALLALSFAGSAITITLLRPVPSAPASAATAAEPKATPPVTPTKPAANAPGKTPRGATPVSPASAPSLARTGRAAGGTHEAGAAVP